MSTAAVPAPLASADIERRIAAERERLSAEESAQTALSAERVSLLGGDDDSAVDRIESQIAASQAKQRRSVERIALLERQQEEARERDHDAALDRIRLRAERARDRGEQIIRGEYRKHAEALAGALARLAACDVVVQDANRILDSNGRSVVAAPNAIRCRPVEYWSEAVKTTVGLDDARHPLHGIAEAHYPHIIRHGDSRDTKPWAQIPGSHEKLDYFAEVDVEVQRYDGPDWVTPLTQTVVLPGVGPSTRGSGVADLWNERSRGLVSEVAAALEREIEAELTGGALSKIGRAAARAVGLGGKQ